MKLSSPGARNSLLSLTTPPFTHLLTYLLTTPSSLPALLPQKRALRPFPNHKFGVYGIYIYIHTEWDPCMHLFSQSLPEELVVEGIA